MTRPSELLPHHNRNHGALTHSSSSSSSGANRDQSSDTHPNEHDEILESAVRYSGERHGFGR